MSEIADIRPFRLRDAPSTRKRRSVIPRESMPSVTCVFCGSSDTEPASIYGCHMMTAQYFCHACRTTFDWVRQEWGADS